MRQASPPSDRRWAATMPDCRTRKTRGPAITGDAAGRADIATDQRTAEGSGCVLATAPEAEAAACAPAGAPAEIDPIATRTTIAVLTRRSLVRARGTSYNKVPDAPR